MTNATATTASCNHCSALLAGLPPGSLCVDQLLNASRFGVGRVFAASMLLEEFNGDATLAREYVNARVGSKVGFVQIVSLVAFFFAVLSTAFYIRALVNEYAKTKSVTSIKTNDKIFTLGLIAVLGLNIVAIWPAFSAFNRSVLVRDVVLTDGSVLGEDDYCALNQHATPACEFQSFLTGMSTIGLAAAVAMLGVDMYHGLVKQKNKKKLKKQATWYWIWIMVNALLFPLAAHFIAPVGPMGSYCGIRCTEFAIDDEFATTGHCYVRLVHLYGPLMLNGIVTLVHFAAVGRALHKHAKKQKKTSKEGKKNDIVRKTQRKLFYLGVAVGFCESAASIVRVRSSITPDANKEGVVGITELIPPIAGFLGYFLAGYLKAPWGASYLPCGGKKVTSNVQQSTVVSSSLSEPSSSS